MHVQVYLIIEVLHNSLTLGVGLNTKQPQHLSHAPETLAARFRSVRTYVRPLMCQCAISARPRMYRLLSVAVLMCQCVISARLPAHACIGY